MERIPRPGGGTVADSLRATTESAIAPVDDDTWFRFYRRRLDAPFAIAEALELFFQDLDVDSGDVGLFGAKILQFFASSDQRRLGEYEHLSWWSFLQSDDYSPKFQRLLRAVPRTMVAMDPRRSSARTVGTISMQLLLDFASTGVTNDLTMGRATSETWLAPWAAHLAARGVTIATGATVHQLDVVAGRIAGALLVGDPTAKAADHYVLAVPIDVAHDLISPALGALDPALERLRTAHIDDLVSWMVGIQYFLYEDVALVRGHTFYPDSPWALTTISQAQFWRDGGLFRTRYGDGQVGGVISVDVSDWDTPGTYVPLPAKQCTPAQVADETWRQLKAALNGSASDAAVLSDALLHSWHLDADLDYATIPPLNRSRLLVHPPGSWAIRPEAATAVPNLVLASDYVRTHTDLATMEGACEAGRRAANAILDRDGSPAARSAIWPLEEPAEFEPWKRIDAALYAAGAPHLFEILGVRRAGAALEILRRASALTGLDRLDDLLDRVRITDLVRRTLARIGID